MKKVGIDATSAANPAEVHKQYKKLKGPWTRLKAQIQLIRDESGALRKTLLTILIALVPVAGLLVKTFVEQYKLPAVLGSWVVIAGAFIVAVKPYWKQFREAYAKLQEKNALIESERARRINELENEINVLTRESREADREAEAITLEVQNLEQEITTTTTSKLIAQFIEDRAAASDYRRHLGLLALIRRDFEKLRDLFREQREEEDEGKETIDKKRINRIILYIDDLDRCPPERVVQVLQAIHLLLAFPLFVVVVGVDSRWVTRSLEQSYEWLREEDDEDDEDARNGNKRTRDKDENRSGEGATPHDYLDKIFQIPFWLTPMNKDACIEFLDGLTKDSADDSVKTKDDAKSVVEPVSERSLPAQEHQTQDDRVMWWLRLGHLWRQYASGSTGVMDQHQFSSSAEPVQNLLKPRDFEG